MIVAVTMVRDEADVIGWTLAHMLSQADHVIVADNRSVDQTRAILDQFDHVTVIDDPEVGYYQADKMTRLAHLAGDMGAEWVIPFDADEAWTINPADLADTDVVEAHPYVYVPRSAEPNPLRWSWRLPEPERLKKVCFRYHPHVRLHMGNHNVDRPGRRTNGAQVRHYQYRSLAQVARKVRQGAEAYDATNLPVTDGSHWRELATKTDDELKAWWEAYVTQPLVFAP